MIGWNGSKRQASHYGIRVGLLYRGRLLEEKIIDAPASVTVGTEPGESTLSIDAPGLPDRLTVIDWGGDGWEVRHFPMMKGRVESDGRVIEPAAEDGLDCDRGGAVRIPLEGDFRGRLQIGEVVVLFQRIGKRPTRNRPSLPRELTGGWLSGIDRRLGGVLALTALLQMGFVGWTLSKSWPKPERALTLTANDVWVKGTELQEAPPLVEPDAEEAPADPAVAESNQRADTESAESTPSSNEPAEPEPADPPPEESATASAPDRNVGESATDGTVLEAIGSEGGDSILAELETASPTGEMDSAIANAEGPDNAAGDDSRPETAGATDGDSTGEAVGGGDIGRAPGAREASSRSTGEREEGQVECHGCGTDVVIRDPAPHDPAESADVSTYVKRHGRQFQRCYERSLKQDTGLAGKLVVGFRVVNGRAMAVHVESDSVGGDVANCVVGVFRRIEFKGVTGGKTQYSKTFVFQSGS